MANMLFRRSALILLVLFSTVGAVLECKYAGLMAECWCTSSQIHLKQFVMLVELHVDFMCCTIGYDWIGSHPDIQAISADECNGWKCFNDCMRYVQSFLN